MLSHRLIGTLTATVIGSAAIEAAAQASTATADGPDGSSKQLPYGTCLATQSI
jgi:hypothetical protein